MGGARPSLTLDAECSIACAGSTEASRMFTAQKCEQGNDAGKWFTVAIAAGGLTRRVGYCARGCPGHESGVAALAHHVQFLLDRESDLWLERQQTRGCEVCGAPTRLRARLGRDTKPYVLCADHQSSRILQQLLQRSAAFPRVDATDESSAPQPPHAEPGAAPGPSADR
jgi:hypothetical protein